jgi:hypothetical protein
VFCIIDKLFFGKDAFLPTRSTAKLLKGFKVPFDTIVEAEQINTSKNRRKEKVENSLKKQTMFKSSPEDFRHEITGFYV